MRPRKPLPAEGTLAGPGSPGVPYRKAATGADPCSKIMASEKSPPPLGSSMRFAPFESRPENDRLGGGRLPEVYGAVDVELGRTAALKILRPHAEIDPASDVRFKREAQHTSLLKHPNIATIYECGKD